MRTDRANLHDIVMDVFANLLDDGFAGDAFGTRLPSSSVNNEGSAHIQAQTCSTKTVLRHFFDRSRASSSI